MLDTGQMLEDFITNNRVSKSALGEKIGRNGLSILNYTRNTNIRTHILWNICEATKHNFFKDIANLLPETFTETKIDNKTLITEKDQLIAQLQEENKVLKIQNEILLRIKGG